MSIRGRKEKTPVIVNRSLFLFLAGFVLLLDQLTKAWILSHLSVGQSEPLLPNIFHLTLVENRGIAFGLFYNFDQILFPAITLSIIVLVVMGFRSHAFLLRIQWAIGLILGGAVGNWIDRMRFGAVIDFLDFRFWPVFNVADTAITIGVGLFLIDLFKKSDAS